MRHSRSNSCYFQTLQSGFTLVELIISMVIISISLTGILSVMNLTVSRSADPMIQSQAIAIAESYLEEILAKDYCEDVTDAVNCPLISGSESGETRATFNDVDDYNGLSDTGVIDSSATAITALSSYDVSVAVAVVSSGDFSGVTAKKVTVTVSHAAIGSIDLLGYRSSY